ncbi:hemicentin-2 [Hyalella azteca]|uniref:Hemicentin-2 n=1 Tax=Hyalella azteca TaxID=294128 RepID=A0A8B7NXR3_HYAAZ|nr:hemicentin-2 [Hyalella azteca]
MRALVLQLLLLPLCVRGVTGPLEETPTSMLSVTGVAGQTSRLPCPLTPRSSGDVPKLVLWYRTGDSAPIYSQDGRSKQESSPKQYGKGSQDQVFSKPLSRKYDLQLTPSHHSATLTLRHTTPLSAGLYECRVDFYRSPSHTNFVNLTVIEPPVRLSVLDGGGLAPRQGRLGPYTENAPVSLACTAVGGDPPPSLTWIRDGDVTLDESYEAGDEGETKNTLTIEQLTRDWRNSTLTCLASNSDLVAPLTLTFVLDVILLPTRVVITGPVQGGAGEVVTLRCTSEGSEPPAALSWLVRGQALQGQRAQYGDAVSSLLTLNLTKEDNGAVISCQAVNPALPRHPLLNTTTITVMYAPVVRASLGRSLSLTSIREGNDVYFNCHVEGNPPVTHVAWYHEAEEQVQDVSSGVILAGQSLVLQRVNRSRSGDYSCSARNPVGTTHSSAVTLTIKYLPECQSRTVTYFIYSDPINVTCSYAAYPRLTQVFWHWNATSDVNNTKSVDRLQQIYSNPLKGNGDVSTAQLTVYPSMSPDDRELTCRGVNELGNQTKSCKFFIKRAKTPAPLSSCRLANITASSLSLTCEHPDLPTETAIAYTAQVYFENGTSFVNLSSPEPNFNVSHLDQGTNYQIKVYVSQGPITSQPVLVSASTSRDGLRQTIRSQKSTTPPSLWSLVAIALSTVLTTAVLLFVLTLLRRSRMGFCGKSSRSPTAGRSRAASYSGQDVAGSAAEDEALRKDEILQAEYFTNTETSASLEELNPDVVPSKGEDPFDLLPCQSYYVRCPVDAFSFPARSPCRAYRRRSQSPEAEEGRPMLASAKDSADEGRSVDDGRSVEDGRSAEDERSADARRAEDVYGGPDNASVRYTMGVTIGGVGQSVTSLFRSRSRSHNITSFLSKPDEDHETIV